MKKITKGGKGKMNQNTFGQTKAARDLILHLKREQVGKKTIRKISKKIADYNRGLNAIIEVKDSKIKERLLYMWKEKNLDDIDNIEDVSINIINHLKNVQLAYFNRKAYKRKH